VIYRSFFVTCKTQPHICNVIFDHFVFTFRKFSIKKSPFSAVRLFLSLCLLLVCFQLVRSNLLRDSFGFQMISAVHAEATSATTEPIAFRSILPSVALFAIEFLFVFGTVGWIQHFIAHTAFEARFVEFVSASDPLFGCIYWFAALWAFRVLNWLERHFGFLLAIRVTS